MNNLQLLCTNKVFRSFLCVNRKSYPQPMEFYTGFYTVVITTYKDVVFR